MYQTQTSSTLLSELLKLYPPVLNLEEGAKLLRFPTVNALRIAQSRDHLPVPVRKIGKRNVLFLTDIAQFLESGNPQCLASPRTALHRVEEPKQRRGRPKKSEQVARRNAGNNSRSSDSTRRVGGLQ